MYWRRDLGKILVPLSFYIWGLSFKTNLFNCEADPLKCLYPLLNVFYFRNGPLNECDLIRGPGQLSALASAHRLKSKPRRSKSRPYCCKTTHSASLADFDKRCSQILSQIQTISRTVINPDRAATNRERVTNQDRTAAKWDSLFHMTKWC